MAVELDKTPDTEVIEDKSVDLDEAKKTMYPSEEEKAAVEAAKAEEEPPEEEKPTEEEEELPEEDNAEATPEAITAEDIKFPEGVEVDIEVQKDFLAISNDKDMKPKEKAQALIDLQTELYQHAHQTKLDNWVAEVNADKKFVGDDGTKLPENLALAKKGMEALKIEGLSGYLDASGEGNNPLIVEAFMKIGSAISEDTFVVGGKGAETKDRTPAQVLYGDSQNK